MSLRQFVELFAWLFVVFTALYELSLHTLTRRTTVWAMSERSQGRRGVWKRTLTSV